MRLLVVLLASLFIAQAHAQTDVVVNYRSGTSTIQASAANPLPVTASGGTQAANLTQIGGSAVTAITAGADAVSNTSTGLQVYSYPSWFNGTTWDRARGTTNGGYAQGSIAAGAADAGNPLKIGGIYTSTLPTLTNGLRGDAQLGTRGSLNTTLFQPDSANPWVSSVDNSDAIAASGAGANAGLKVTTRAYLYNGTTWDRQRGDTFGIYSVATASSAAAAGITPVVTGAAAGSLVLKASAGNLYAVQITTAGSAGYLLINNTTSAPSDGAVTPLYCKAVAANSSVEMAWPVPVVFATGITAVFSTTGCFTQTASATAFISGQSK